MIVSFIQSLFPPVNDASGRFSWRLTIHHSLYYLLLVTLAGAQSVSNYMMSGMQILLAVNWALEWDMRRKFGRGGLHPLLVAFLVLAAVHLLWMIPTANIDSGLADLFGKLPLLAIPLIVLTSRPLNRNQFFFIAFFFVGTVFVATIIGHVRYATMPDLAYREIIPFISHIRFALNVCLAILFLIAFLTVQTRRRGEINLVELLSIGALIVYFLHFLLLIHSYTAFVILFVVSIVMLIAFGKRCQKKWRITLVTLFSVVVIAVVAVLGSLIRDYYRPVPLLNQPLATHTANGNPYLHKQDGLIENGNLIDNYVCNSELTTEWRKRSQMELDSVTSNGYAVYPTLLRYLNALGTTKDSVGMQLLTPEDVRAIEQGIANPVYLHGSKLRTMVYVMLYEYESARVLGSVKNFTMLQRFELWEHAWEVFVKHPLFGVGTGDVKDACMEQLKSSDSPLAGIQRNPHNQYLSFLVSFGLIGTVVLFAAFIIALRRLKLRERPLLVAYIVVLLVSFITENTLSTLAGCVFSTTFFCLLSQIPDGETSPNYNNIPTL